MAVLAASSQQHCSLQPQSQPLLQVNGLCKRCPLQKLKGVEENPTRSIITGAQELTAYKKMCGWHFNISSQSFMSSRWHC